MKSFALIVSGLILLSCTPSAAEVETFALSAIASTTSATQELFTILKTEKITENQWCVSIEEGNSVVSILVVRESKTSPFYDKQYFYNQTSCQRDEFRLVRGN
jgi:hypothetical protein